jgi:hypothetical protein
VRQDGVAPHERLHVVQPLDQRHHDDTSSQLHTRVGYDVCPTTLAYRSRCRGLGPTLSMTATERWTASLSSPASFTQRRLQRALIY